MKQLDPRRFQRGLQLSSAPLGLKLHPSLQALKPELDSALKTMLEEPTRQAAEINKILINATTNLRHLSHSLAAAGEK
jgi:hypothetical protein